MRRQLKQKTLCINFSRCLWLAVYLTRFNKGVYGTYCVVDAPHKHAQERFISPEKLDFLVFDSKMFLFQLGLSTGTHHDDFINLGTKRSPKTQRHYCTALPLYRTKF